MASRGGDFAAGAVAGGATAGVGSEGENGSPGVASTIIRLAWDAIERSGWLASGTAVARGQRVGRAPRRGAAMADAEAFAPSEEEARRRPRAGRETDSRRRGELVSLRAHAAASAPPVAAGRGLAPGDIATESGTSESGTLLRLRRRRRRRRNRLHGRRLAARRGLGERRRFALRERRRYVREHITSAGVHPGNVGGHVGFGAIGATTRVRRARRAIGGPRRSVSSRLPTKTSSATRKAAGGLGTPSAYRPYLHPAPRAGRATSRRRLVLSAHARPPGGVLNPAEAAAAVHSDPGVSAAPGNPRTAAWEASPPAWSEAQKRRRRTDWGPRGAGEGRWRDGAGDAVVGTSPASPTPTSSSSGAICVPPTSSSLGVFFVVRSVIRPVPSRFASRQLQSPASSSSSSSSRSDTAGPSSSAVGSATSASASAEARPRDASRGSSPAGWARRAPIPVLGLRRRRRAFPGALPSALRVPERGERGRSIRPRGRRFGRFRFGNPSRRVSRIAESLSRPRHLEAQTPARAKTKHRRRRRRACLPWSRSVM